MLHRILLREFELDEEFNNSDYNKKKEHVLQEFLEFLSGTLAVSEQIVWDKISPRVVRRFLIFKEDKGKKQLHGINCKYFNTLGEKSCLCPKIMAPGSISNIISKLKLIFYDKLGTVAWDDFKQIGNPVSSPIIVHYLKSFKQKVAEARIIPTQAKPLFFSKLKKIVDFIETNVNLANTVQRKYVLLRDKTFLLIQFFAGDRCIDTSRISVQDFKVIKTLDGIVINRTFGKAMRGGDSKANTFVLKIMQDHKYCPVISLNNLVRFLRENNISYSTGYLFRALLKNTFISEKPISHAVMYKRLKYYLNALNINEGETPHSLRAGFAVLMMLAGKGIGEKELAAYVGWTNTSSLLYYSRIRALNAAETTADKVIEAIKDYETAENRYKDFETLRKLY